MRIRKRSVTALSLSSKADVSYSNGRIEEEQMMKEKQQFLLPLVAAAMDVQARAHAHFGEQEDGHAIAQIHPQKWRNALLRCTTERDALQTGGEGDESYCRWDGLMRKTGGDKFRLVTSQGCAKECTPSSLDGDRELSKSGECEKKALEVGAAMKKQRSKSDCTKKCHANEERKTSPKMKDKADEENKNLHAGSQCRRRNGRGWRCSERTLVGYYLCEHHLGKGRLKSINNSISTSTASVIGNGKGTKFKELHLIHAASASASASAL